MDHKDRISELANLMDEFKLAEATLSDESISVTFKRRSKGRANVDSESEYVEFESATEREPVAPQPPAVIGTPISSPMTGIFYASPSPNSPAFVKEGDVVTAGQVIGLIEAMKVFNEIPSPITGIAKKVIAETGQIVNLGDVLILVG